MREFLNALQQRILILDGAMGTLIQDQGLEGNNDEFSRTHPQVIATIHRDYLEAGADIIETNSFNATRISQADYGLEDECYEINLAAARVARAVADEFTTDKWPRFVAGSMGPTNKTASMSSDVSDPGARVARYDDFHLAYTEQARGLIDGGCDVLLVETVFDTLNCKAALHAIADLFAELGRELPVMVSGTITDQSGRTLSGQTVEAFWSSISHFPLAAVGFNCALGPEQMRPHLETISGLATCGISCYPNAGLPNEFGEYDLSPAEMAAQVGEFATAGFINLVGGCCGTTPEHIAAIRAAVAEVPPRVAPAHDGLCRLSGLEELCIRTDSNFINIGERCNVSGSRRFARLIREEKFDQALVVARHQVENGAQILDICMDDGLLDSAICMQRFVDLLAAEPDIIRIPLMLDSSEWEVIEAGLKSVQGRSILNSISLKDGEEEFIRRATIARNMGAAVVVMAFDPDGQAVDVTRRIAIVSRSRELLLELGFGAHEMIFDLNVLAVATGLEEHDRYALSFIEATRELCKLFPGILISGGVSNLSFAFRGADHAREAMHSVFLYHAIKAGMRMGIVNPGQLAIYSELDPEVRELAEDVVLARSPDAGERLLEWVHSHSSDSSTGAGSATQPVDEWRKLPAGERLAHALVRGNDSYLEQDLPEIFAEYDSALAVIEGPLMDGMNEVGELFGSGQMFLPQVVKSARVMKKAVAWLEPHLAKSGQSIQSRGTILMATVKGDVHDIGKNIVGVVLGCNGYEIVDLGVMVPCEKIIARAAECNADLIGLSGLITPSLKEMTHVAAELERLGIDTPVLIGGATTSPVHTAVKIAPARSGPIIHVNDASRSVAVVSALLSDKAGEYVKKNHQRQQQLRERRAERQAALAAKGRSPLSIEQARERKVVLESKVPPSPNFLGARSFKQLPIEEVCNLIDWKPLLQAWEVSSSGRGAAAKDPNVATVLAQEAAKLLVDAKDCLNQLISESSIRVEANCGFWPARSELEQVFLEPAGTEEPVVSSISFSRQLRDAGADRPNRSLADFISPQGGDHLGAFTVCVLGDYEQLAITAATENDDFKSLLIKSVADRMAEAGAEYLHQAVRRDYWGYDADEEIDLEAMLNERYQGIRPAPGYPACPEHPLKQDIISLLGGPETTGITLTENHAMIPPASVCGFYFARPEACYFGVGNTD